jgi:uncharacterized membrane protein
MRLCVVWHWLRSSFWFVPSLMIVAAALLSYITLQADDHLLDYERFNGWWLYSGSMGGAREILAVIAGSMITVAGVVFSITIVVLSLASSQFGPRLIWNFMHDIWNQIVLGTFVSTFTYSLLVLGRIQEQSGSPFVPYLSITVGILLGVASLGVLIYFIHHISSSIHASSVAAAVWRDLQETIKRLAPETATEAGKPDCRTDDVDQSVDFSTGVCPVPAGASGYVEATNHAGLLKTATERDLVLRIEFRAGQFIVRGECLALVRPGDRVDQSLVEEINAAFVMGPQRTLEQDVEFSIHQLVEIAVRALSPGVNDPFTAMTCVDWLGAALCDFLDRKRPSPYLCDDHGKVRVIMPQFTFSGLMDAAFNNIRQNARRDASVTIRLLESLAVIAQRAARKEDIASVARHAGMIKRGSDEGLPEEDDRKDVEVRLRKVMEAIASKTAS